MRMNWRRHALAAALVVIVGSVVASAQDRDFTPVTDGDALYTNSVLALEPQTGRLEWYYQFVPGETHDLDEVFESVLIDHNGRQSLFKMGKLGIL